MSSRSSNPRVLGPTVSRKATGKIGGRGRQRVPSAGRAGAQAVLVAQPSRVQFSGPAQEKMWNSEHEVPLTIFLGVPPPRCTTVPPCGHCWYCGIYAVQNP